MDLLKGIPIKVNESRYISLFVFSGSINKLFSIYCTNVYLFSIFFSIDFERWRKLFSIECVSIYLYLIFFFYRFFPVEKSGVTPKCLYRDSLTIGNNFKLQDATTESQ